MEIEGVVRAADVRDEPVPATLLDERVALLRGSDAGTLAYRRFPRDTGVAWHH